MPNLYLPTLEDQIAELKRELSMRETVYPKWIFDNRLKKETADLRIERLESAIVSLEELLRRG